RDRRSEAGGAAADHHDIVNNGIFSLVRHGRTIGLCGDIFKAAGRCRVFHRIRAAERRKPECAIAGES
ncbi:MAG TPA: hypothetical protein VIQ05_12550, partial [Tardiphaga sp.]